jgi:hypothetical protein
MEVDSSYKSPFMIKYLTLALMLVFLHEGRAQGRKQTCMPGEGYWVVESNVKTPRTATVWFYTPENILVFKQNFEGRKLKVKRPKTVRQLNAVLHQSIVAWNQDLQKTAPLVKLRR